MSIFDVRLRILSDGLKRELFQSSDDREFLLDELRRHERSALLFGEHRRV